MIDLIQQRHGAVAEACRQFGVGRLEVFGSAARGDFGWEKSDLDFIATFLPPLHPGVAQRFFGLEEALEKIFARRVDLMTDSMLRNPILSQEVSRDRTLIYDYASQEEVA